MPGQDQLLELKSILKHHPAEWMMWEGVPALESAAILKTIGVGSIVFSPCANKPQGMDFLEVMQDNINAVKTIYQKDRKPVSDRLESPL